MLVEKDAAAHQLYHETQCIDRKGRHGYRKKNQRKIARNILHHKTFQCTQCPRRYATKVQLRSHLYQHQYKAKFVCTICNKLCTSNVLLNEHMARHLPQLIRFRCDQTECDKGFLYESSYKQHILTHGGFKCLHPQCGKGFASRYNLQEHEKKHLNLLMYACDVCPCKSFPNQHRLNQHKKSKKHRNWLNYLPNRL